MFSQFTLILVLLFSIISKTLIQHVLRAIELMSDKNSNYLVAFVLMVMLVVTAMSLLKEPEEDYIPIEFGALLDLNKDKATRLTIGSYIVDKDHDPDNVTLVTDETLEEMRITIELGEIKNCTEVWILRNQTDINGTVRQFEAIVKDVLGNEEEEIHGWIDQRRNVYVSFGINWYTDQVSGRDGIWVPNSVRFLDDEYCINKFIEETSDDGYEYWNVTVGPIEISPEDSQNAGMMTRTFSANTKWGDGAIYYPYAGLITEDLEIQYVRLS